jgi:lipopolysaccharide biosynthesis regulator YciM
MALLRSLAILDAADGKKDDATQRLIQHLKSAPLLGAAQALLAQPPSAWGEAGLAGVRAAVDRAAAPLQRYRCAACGFQAQNWFWQCPGCQGWDSFPPHPVEEL